MTQILLFSLVVTLCCSSKIEAKKIRTFQRASVSSPPFARARDATQRYHNVRGQNERTNKTLGKISEEAAFLSFQARSSR